MTVMTLHVPTQQDVTKVAERVRRDPGYGAFLLLRMGFTVLSAGSESTCPSLRRSAQPAERAANTARECRVGVDDLHQKGHRDPGPDASSPALLIHPRSTCTASGLHARRLP